MSSCVHCHQNTGDPARRGLCDGCYSSPIRSCYNSLGVKVDDLAPARVRDEEDGKFVGQFSRGGSAHRRLMRDEEAKR
jgi:hypothetical protein